MKIAVLTSGGEAPGMNAALRAVARTAFSLGWEVTKVEAGYKGLLEGRVSPIDSRRLGGIIGRGGTILGTQRSKELGRDRKRRLPRSGACPRLSRRPSSRRPKGRGYHELQELPAGGGGSERPLGDVHSWDGYVASVLPNPPIFVRRVPEARVLLDYGQEVPLLLGDRGGHRVLRRQLGL